MIPQLVGGPGGLSLPGFRSDSLVYPQQLTQVTATAREVYRPLFWRNLVKVEAVDRLVEVVEDRKLVGQMEQPVSVSQKGPTNELPIPSLSTTNQFLKGFWFGLAYWYGNLDIERAQRLGISLASEQIELCNLGAEQFLEGIASVGLTMGGGASMKGLCNLADVGTPTAVTKAKDSSTKWVANDGTTNATALEMVQDMQNLVNATYVDTKQTRKADVIALPIKQWQAAASTFTEFQQYTALTLFQRQNPGVEIVTWDKLKDQGSGGTPCAMAWDRTDPNGPRMLMWQELQYTQPMQGLGGYLTPGYFGTGGVRCKYPTAVQKMSGL